MERIIKHRYKAFIVLLLTLVVACKDRELEDFKLAKTDPSEVSIDNTTGEIKKASESITIPLSVSLSSPATKAFQVGVQLNIDTVKGLIEGGQLANTVGLEAGAITIPSVVKVPFGASRATFEITLSITALEHHFGKEVAFAFNLVEPGKGNRIGTKGSNVIVLNTRDLLDESEIHFLSFTNGRDGIIEAKNRKNYSMTSAGMTIPLGISLAGVPGSFFTVETKITKDSVTNLIQEGKLPDNTIVLNEDQFYLDKVIKVGSNVSSSPYELSIPSAVISANLDKILAFPITMIGSSKHVIDPRHDYVLVLVYPQLVIEKDVTNEGILSVSTENSGGADSFEGSSKLIDKNYSSKYLINNFGSGIWIQLVYDQPRRIGAYTFTSGNDAPVRDPKVWEVLGSMDGENWKVLDKRTDSEFTARNQTKRFEIAQPDNYTYYRLNIIENYGNAYFQMSEWRMISVP